jgi:hypothetical protein
MGMRLSRTVLWGVFVLGLFAATAAFASTNKVLLIEDFDATW